MLRERGAELHRVELDEGEPLPDWREFDAIVAMGGPMSANDDAELPWLTGEKQLVSDAVRAGKPYWGVCLGVQLLAASLGARVYPGPEPEVGLLPVSLTGEARSDPVFGEAPHELVTLQWHGDTFDLPDGAVRLASSPAYPNQAFRLTCLWRAVPPRGLRGDGARVGRGSRIRRLAGTNSRRRGCTGVPQLDRGTC